MRLIAARRARPLLTALAVLSAVALVVSGVSLSALTAGIEVAPTAIGPPEHTFDEDGNPGGAVRRGPIPRAAFENVRAIPARGPAAFGGDRIYDIDVDGTSYRVHEFTTVGTSTFTVLEGGEVEYLIVAGGGGGGGRLGGGGGAGELRQDTQAVVVQTYSVTVGAGGKGGSGQVDNASDGSSSSVFGITVAGGGRGRTVDQTGFNGGSGGAPGVGGAGNSISGTTGGGLGNNSGTSSTGAQGSAGGGGGAKAPGGDGLLNQAGGAGGAGFLSTITGTALFYAGGGGGGVNTHENSSAGGAGGSGVGGQGGSLVALGAATAGLAGTGSGGGGGSRTDGGSGADGGNGGDGIVIIRYEIPRTTWAPVATGGTVTEFIGDGTGGTIAGFRYRVHAFEEDGGLTVPDGSTIPEVDVLLVAGGGGGGSRHGGGGGGGGVLEVLGHPLGVTGALPVVVGQGGAGTTAASAGQSGGDSVALGLTATGGGRGAGLGHDALVGGSGGGGNATGVSGAGRVDGQGNAGGAGVGTAGNPEGGYGGGGGGGAGQVGFAATSGGATEDASAGRGGDGRVSTLTGSPVVYGGGGGGSISHRSTGVVGVGGLGGGGNGGSLGWELYDASSVGRRLGWRLFLHNIAHPSNAAGFEQFFAGAVHSSGSAALIVADQNATGANLGTPNVLNWVNAGQLADFTGALPRTDNFALEVTGWFVPRESGVYHFTLESDDAADLRIGATTVAAFYGGRGTPSLGTTQGTITLVAGQGYAFRARMEEGSGGEGLRVFWQTPSQRAVSTTTWWQNADEIVGNRPSNSPLDAAELGRFAMLSTRFATQRGLGTITTQTHGVTTTPNTLNWEHPSSGASNQLPLTSVVGVAGLANDFMLTVSGTFVPKETGTYTFALSGDDAVDLAIDGTVIVAHYGQKAAPGVGDRQGTVTVEAGVPVHLTVRHHQRDGGAVLRVFWRKPSQTSGWHQDAEELRAPGRDGVDGLGGGGGAGGFTADSNAAGGRGGDGVVAIRYPLARVVDALPSEVREPIAGEGRSTAVLRWREPAIDPPVADAGGYRIEYAPIAGGSWTVVTGATFAVDPEDGERVLVALSGLPEDMSHRFRITPIGTVDGPSQTVAPIAKGGDVVTLVGDDVVHQFTAVGPHDFTLSSDRSVTVLVVGGGASGTRGQCSLYWGHGGGGGGVSRETLVLGVGAFVATVGGGGPGSTTQSCDFAHTGAAGGVSTLASPVATLLVAAGGSGAESQQARGGTAGTGTIDGVASGGHLGGVGSGGTSGCPAPSACGAGGGGGAGGAGSGDVGGAGVTSSITGTDLDYGRGGAGRSAGVFGDPGLGPQGPGGGGTDQGVAGYTAGNAGTVVLRYAFAPSAPAAPSNVGGTSADGAVSLTWDAPTFTGGSPILDYEVGRSTDGGATWSDWAATGSTETTVTVSGLTNGTAYVFRVRALNAIGASDASAPSSAVTPRTVPGAPLISSVTGGDTTLDVVFSVPSDGGATITNIEYRIDDGPWITRSPESAASPLTLTGLENDRAYTVRLRAINAVGTGEESAPATGTPIEGFIGDFVGGEPTGPELRSAWATFRASLTGEYDTFTVTSSLGLSVTVTHPTDVQQLANGLRTATATSVTIGGVSWNVGRSCGANGSLAFSSVAVEFSNNGSCTCASLVSFRPDRTDRQWGGFGTSGAPTCGTPPSQRLTLTFRRTLP